MHQPAGDHDQVAVAVGAEVVAQHARAFRRGAKVLDARHVLSLLERKHRAVPEATALMGWRLAPGGSCAPRATHTRKPDQKMGIGMADKGMRV